MMRPLVEREQPFRRVACAWSYAGQKYQDILTHVLTNGRLKERDALVLDLRGGWGGASPSYLNLLRVPRARQGPHRR